MGWRMLPLLLGFLWLCPAGSADSQRAPKLPGMPDVNRRQAGEPIAVEAHHGAELVYLERRMLANSGSLEEYGTQRVGGRWLRGSLAPGAGRLAEPPPPPPPTDFSKLPNFEIGVPAPPTLQIWEWQRQQQLLGVRDPPLELSSSSFVQPGRPGPGFVAMCVIARDAHADLLEWINHHLKLGVSKVYLWDHGSRPPMRSVITSYIAAGTVEYQHFEAFEHPSGKPQLYAYDRCLAAAQGRHDWVAFLDIDEFLVFKGPGGALRSLPQLLLSYQEFSGLAVHWLLFGSSGHKTRPLGGMLRSYYRRLPALHAQHQLVKSIVRVRCTSGAWGPHAFHHTCAQPVVRTDFSPIEGPRNDRPVHDVLAVHHYATRSREEFEIKMSRGSGMKRQRGWEYFDFVDSWSTEVDFDGLRIWDDNDLFQRYPSITQETLARYTTEAHEEHWLRGATPATAAAASATTSATAGAGAGTGAGQTAAGAAAGAVVQPAATGVAGTAAAAAGGASTGVAAGSGGTSTSAVQSEASLPLAATAAAGKAGAVQGSAVQAAGRTTALPGTAAAGAVVQPAVAGAASSTSLPDAAAAAAAAAKQAAAATVGAATTAGAGAAGAAAGQAGSGTAPVARMTGLTTGTSAGQAAAAAGSGVANTLPATGGGGGAGAAAGGAATAAAAALPAAGQVTAAGGTAGQLTVASAGGQSA